MICQTCHIILPHKTQITSCSRFCSGNSSLSAWDFDLLQELLQPTLAAPMIPKTTLQLVTEIVSSILNLRSVVFVAKSEHSANPVVGRAEKLV